MQNGEGEWVGEGRVTASSKRYAVSEQPLSKVGGCMAADTKEEGGVEILGRVGVDSRLLGEKLDREAVTLLFRLLAKELTRPTKELLIEEMLEKTVFKELK
jgi:hypothetical protein